MFNKKRLIEIMELKDVSAYKLWKLSGVAQSTISDILNKDDKNPTIKTLERIAAALEVPVDELLSNIPSDEKLDEWDKKYNKDGKLAEEVKEIKTKYILNKIPEEFTDPVAARAYINKHEIFASEGFDINKLSDNEVLEFANALLEQMRMVSYKYKR